MANADQVVRRLLDYLEPRIDLTHVTAVAARHRAALNYEPLDRLPLVCYLPYEGEDFTPYSHAEAFHDPAKLMVNELLTGFTSIYHAVDLKDDSPYCLRPNLGVTIIASMLGATIRIMDDQPPWVLPFEDLHQIKEIAASSPPDSSAGLLPRVLEQYDYFRHALADYPNCRAGFQLTLPDLQGPFDVAEMIWGADIFMAFYDDVGLLSALLANITDTIIRVQRRLKAEVQENLGPDCQYQHAVGVKGQILLRDDTVILLSPQHYHEMVQPHDSRIAAELGSVAIHFCGNGQHQIDNMLSIPDFTCFDFGQPWMMASNTIYAKSAAQKVPLARMRVPGEELTAAKVLEKFPTGTILTCEPESVRQARQWWQQYLGRASLKPGRAV